MGSPGSEVDRYKQEETLHRQAIPRSFAVATKKVTVEQFLQFRPNHNFPIGYAPQRECPIISVTWFDAIQYCQWLNIQEGIPESEWCYPKDIKEGMLLPEDLLSRTGYRLATEAEWEYACRAGTITSRCYGSAKDMLGHYAWYFNNAEDPEFGERAWPVGLLKPNALGLFDLHGDVWEWCQNRYRPYAEVPPGQAVLDLARAPFVADDQARVVRGGSLVNRAPIVRSAARNKYEPKRAYYYVGFRIVRTVR
jgi:formylglycine-generating enzyme required for sulfatase activity